MQPNAQKYVTLIPNSGFRIGHKLDDLISGFILAEWYGLQYLHSPLTDNRWEEFFGFGENEERFSEDFRKEIAIISCSPILGIQRLNPKSRFLFKYIEQIEYRMRLFLKKFSIDYIRKWRRPYWDGAPLNYFEKVFKGVNSNEEVVYCFQKGVRVMLYQIHIWGRQGRISPDIYWNVIRKLRDKYHSKSHPAKKCYFNPDVLNIAVHIRRDDASVENQRFLPLSFYTTVIQQLEKEFDQEPHEFHIYSSGAEAEMDELRNVLGKLSEGIKFHLNEPAMEAVHHMAVADILVVGQSSFSHWSGFLSENVKLYHPHFHMFDLNEDEWVTMESNGSFDAEHLRRLLLTKRLQPV